MGKREGYAIIVSITVVVVAVIHVVIWTFSGERKG
jgi:hypothetical protein